MSDNKEKMLEMKKKSAQEALKFVREGMIIGVGSGSTVREFIKLLSESKLNIKTIICIPSSFDTEQLLIENNLQVGALNQYPKIDLTIDGADRVDSKLNVIKGGGGAHLREKIIAAAAKEVIIIVDESKLVESLGGSFLVPVEVIPHAKEFVLDKIKTLGGEPKIRKASDKLGPTVSDNGNIILDVDFQEMKNPDELEKTINNIPGVMENGIFPNRLISKVIIATATEIKIKKK
ncbi:MAG: ribose-5-phosphate isomerase RpiA [Candidatus Heimdallarchaeota archaeon]|nr:ribose-5-phosphate isomerase RpiA [Candidatus Heimdallarchaeota archaeon]